jgi:pyruvate/2-oxoglutarate dehydrogenase complex dihydrolipoamide acyltransferase (E2) component
MPFSCKLTVPSYNDSPIDGRLDSWLKKPTVMLQRGDAIAEITIDSIRYFLCVDFPCALGGLQVQAGDPIKTGDLVATCGADGESIPYGRDYCVVRPA